MAKYIPLDAVLAEIEKLKGCNPLFCTIGEREAYKEAICDAIDKIFSLETKEVDLNEETLHSELRKIYASVYDSKDIEAAKHFFKLGVRVQKEEKYEVPSVSKTEDVSVTSRMAMIDDDLKPIAEFILDYAGWNLHKDEWNHPVLEVPLFRVLDALIQRGKPYCGKN